MDLWCKSCRDHWETPVQVINSSPPDESNLYTSTEIQEQDNGGLSIIEDDEGTPTEDIENSSINAVSNDDELWVTKSSLVHIYLRMLYSVGLIPSAFAQSTKPPDGALNILRKITFASTAFLSLFQALNEIKDRTYGDARLDHVFGHISIAYFVSVLAILVLYFHALMYNSSKLHKTLESFSKASAAISNYPKALTALPLIVGIISAIESLAKAMFEGMDVTDWSLEFTVLTKSYRLRRAFSL